MLINRPESESVGDEGALAGRTQSKRRLSSSFSSKNLTVPNKKEKPPTWLHFWAVVHVKADVTDQNIYFSTTHTKKKPNNSSLEGESLERWKHCLFDSVFSLAMNSPLAWISGSCLVEDQVTNQKEHKRRNGHRIEAGPGVFLWFVSLRFTVSCFKFWRNSGHSYTCSKLVYVVL